MKIYIIYQINFYYKKMEKTEKQKLFEAFEKICKIKLINEDFENNTELPSFLYVDEELMGDAEIRNGAREDAIVTKQWNEWLSKNCNNF